MIFFISKGVPYNEKKEQVFKVWHKGNIIQLTQSQKIIWNYLYGSIKSYNDILKYIYFLLKEKKIFVSKEKLHQVLTQLKSLDLITYEEEDNIQLCEFILIAKNKIKILKNTNIENNFEKQIYEFFQNYDNMSLSDFLTEYNNEQDPLLTNGYNIEYIKFAYNCNFRKNTIEAIKHFINAGICYIE